MKTIHRIIFVCLVSLAFTAAVNAQGRGSGSGNGLGPGGGRGTGAMSAPAEGRQPERRAAVSSVETLDRFLSMSDEELEAIEATIRRIRSMTPEERVAYREKIRGFYELPDVERERLQIAWGQLDLRVREQWREYMQSLDIEERESVQAELRQTEPEKKVAWRLKKLREAGFRVEQP